MSVLFVTLLHMARVHDLVNMAIDQVVRQGTDPGTVAAQLHAFLVRMGRAYDMQYVARVLDRKIAALPDTETLRITSPFPVSQSLSDNVQRKFSASDVVADVDTEMIGGFEAEYSGKEVSMNIDHALHTFEKHLIS